MTSRPAADGRSSLFLAAVCLLSALVLSPAVEASRGLPAALAPALEAPTAPDQVLEAELTDPPQRLQLFDDLRLPPRPLELVEARKTASGVKHYDLGLNIRQTGGLSRNCGGLSFQGLWTDPVTGIAYARNRWYDARTASWLSEDSMGAVDSPNLYAFVGWGPHEGTDPLGLMSPGLESHTRLAAAAIVEDEEAFLESQRNSAAFAAGAVSGVPARLWEIGTSIVMAPFRIPEAIRRDSEAKEARMRAMMEGGYEAYRAELDAQSAETRGTLLSLIPVRNAGREIAQVPQTIESEGWFAGGSQFGGGVTGATVDVAALYGATRALRAGSTGPNQVVASAEVALRSRPAAQQPIGSPGVVLFDAKGATAAEILASTGGPTGGSRIGQAAVRQQLLDAVPEGTPYTCWRCGQTSTNPTNMHVGHRNVSASAGGNLVPENVCLEGAACNLSAGNRGAPSAGMSCAERGSCGAPFGRTD